MAASRAIRIQQNGGPEQLQLETIDVGHPGPDEVLIRHGAIGLNFTDIHHRTGRYPGPGFPLVLGMEAAGEILEVGTNIHDFKPGDRVAYGGASPSLSPGAYTELRLMGPAKLVKLPDWLDDETAAAVFLKGLTAEYLIHGAYQVRQGHVVLIHAAAGGVGLLLCQWCRHLGATVIGTVSSPSKADLAVRNGCQHAINSLTENVAERVRAITDGVGADVVFDGVGAATFEGSLASVRARGMIVSYGSASGAVPPFDIFRLNRLGSLYLAGAGLANYTSDRRELEARAQNLFDAIRTGVVRVEIHQRYPLAEAARAHRDLEARRTAGSSVILP